MINSDSSLNLSSARQKILLFFLALFSIYLIIFIFKILKNPNSLEFREGAALVQTQILLNGQRPYMADSYPAGTNVYGIFYSLVVFPIAFVAGNTFFVHRVVSIFFILMIGLLLFLVFRKNRINLISCYAASLTLGAMLLSSSASLARPDSLGLFLFLFPLAILHLKSDSDRSYLFGIFLPILAWLTKPYFILSALSVFLHTLLHRRFMKTVVWSLSTGLLLFLTVWGCYVYFDFYINDTFFVNVVLSSTSVPYLILQVKNFLYDNFFMIMALIIGVAIYLPAAQGKFYRLKDLVFLPGAGIFVIQFLISSLVFLRMGQHRGSAEYALHFLVPALFFLVGFLRLSHSLPKAFMFLIFLQMITSTSILPTQKSYIWDDFSRFLKDHQGPVFHAPPTVFLAIKNGEKVYDSGQSEYFRLGSLATSNPAADLVKRVSTDFENDLISKIDNHYFSVVVIPQNGSGVIDMERLKKNYTIAKIVTILIGPTPWTLELWIPQ